MDVLVVGSDADMRDALRDMLEDAGYRVRAAPDARAALAYLRRTRTPHIVLVDELVPGLAGTQEVGAYLQAHAPTRRREFILLTTSPQATPLNGRVPVVEKPFDIEVLLWAMAQASARLEGREATSRDMGTHGAGDE
jgi:CheY-like chemotaxis protein